VAYETATELLSGSEYPTSCITLLFRAELASVLDALTTDSDVIAELKTNMKARFDHRFPINELLVCAAMLDPSPELGCEPVTCSVEGECFSHWAIVNHTVSFVFWF